MTSSAVRRTATRAPNQALRKFTRNRLAIAGLVMLLLIALGVTLAGFLPFDPDATNLRARFQGPSLQHPFGTDDLGRDVLTRVLYGGRMSLLVGLLAMGISILIGTVAGALAGFFGGWLDSLFMRLTDLFLALPSLFVLIVLSTMLQGKAFLGPWSDVALITLIIGGMSWMVVARIVRSSFLAIRNRDFVEAARASGGNALRLMLRHVLPNALGSLLVQATLQVAVAIIAESGLSYLGFGIQPPTATWGNMLKDAQSYMTRFPWLAVFPGLMIFLTVISVNAVGDGLRDAFDPRRPGS